MHILSSFFLGITSDFVYCVDVLSGFSESAIKQNAVATLRKPQSTALDLFISQKGEEGFK